MTLLPFLAMKLNVISLKKKKNALHPSLVFTHEKEISNLLSFLVVLEKKSKKKFLTSVYRKSKFTGQYTPWDLFGPKKSKTNLIGILVHRALEICSPEKLSSEVNKIKNILRQKKSLFPELKKRFQIFKHPS